MYFGSVKFFKNVILAIVILAVGISVAFAVYYHSQWVHLRTVSEDASAPGKNATYPAVQSDAINYQELYPDFYAPQAYGATDRQSGMVYLTFDGSVTSETADLLRILSEKDVKATFFLSGATDAADPATLEDILSAGHTIGMAAWSVDYSTLYASVDSYLANTYQLFTYIKEATGVTPTLFRFPGGSVNSYNAGFYQELIAEMIRRGFVPCDWNINISSLSGNDIGTVLDTVTEQLSTMDRAVISLRPDAAAVEILPLLIDHLQSLNYSCAALQSNTKPVLFAYPQ